MMPATGTFVFGPFRLESARRELLAHGVPVSLGQRAFEVLLALVRRHGDLVTKDELMAEVWPGIAVEENNLQVHVSTLRKVLGAAGDGERYLLTVAGRGYRFVAPVDCESAAQRDAPNERMAAAAGRGRSAPHNLPQPPTSLIGREAELTEIKARLGSRRLVTLTGAGGVGKTRLAIEVGHALLHDYSDGVWLTELAPLSDPQLVAAVVANATGVTLTSATSALDGLVSALESKHLLLVIDNCEHVIAEVARVTEALVRHCPQLSILASSSRTAGGHRGKRYPRPVVAGTRAGSRIDRGQRAQLCGGATVRGARELAGPRICSHRRQCRDGIIDLPQARRHPARDRIGRAAADGAVRAAARAGARRALPAAELEAVAQHCRASRLSMR